MPDSTVTQCLSSLPSSTKTALCDQWLQLFKKESPPAMRKDLMLRIIAYRLQEQEFGGLSDATRRRLRQLANAFEADATATVSTRPPIKPGTRLVRQWKERVHVVNVEAKSYEYKGARYESLSEIARLITGTRTGTANLLFFSNSGNAALRISAVSVDGDFSISQNLCKGTLQPGQYCLIYIVFSPTLAGIRTGTLSIASNDPVYPKAGISLEGYGDSVYASPIVASLFSPGVQIENGTVTIEVTGANFYPGSVVRINGKPQTTTFSSDQQLQATLDSELTTAIGELSVTVFNPSPGGGTSVGIPLTRYRVVNVDAASITSVSGSNLLYASIPSNTPTDPNTVISINPVSGVLGKPIPVGQNPGVIASSSDGSYLFVVANQDQTVQRVNLKTHAVDRTFPFQPNGTTCCGALSGRDLKGMPGIPQEFVLALDIPGYGFGEMALYNDSGLVKYVPTTAVGTADFSSFAYVDNATTIYSLPFTIAQTPFFNIVTINSQGLQFTPYQGGNFGGNNTVGSQVVSDGTLLYTNSGEVWNPATQTQVGSFPVTSFYQGPPESRSSVGPNFSGGLPALRRGFRLDRSILLWSTISGSHWRGGTSPGSRTTCGESRTLGFGGLRIPCPGLHSLCPSYIYADEQLG
jgi:hypothetical protein